MIRVRMRRTEIIRYWLPAAVWSATLLSLSGQEASSERSGGWLLWLVAHTVGELEPEQFAILHIAIRKASHLFAYGLLWALDFRAVRGPRFGWNTRWAGLAIVLAGTVAAADELIQSFVPSRSGLVSDFVLDLTGAAVALLIWMLFSRR